MALEKRLGAAAAAKEQRANVIQDAKKRGIPLIMRSDRWLGKRWTVEAISYPGRTEAVGQLLRAIGVEHGTGIYSWLCGVAHSTAFALMQYLDFNPLSDRPDTYLTVPQQTLGHLGATVSLSVQAYLWGMRRFADLNGWDVAMLQSWRRSRAVAAFIE